MLDLSQLPLSWVVSVALVFVLLYWAIWRVRKDIQELMQRLARLDTLSTVDKKLSDALLVITAQADRLDAMEKGIKETAAATAAAVAEELRRSKVLHRAMRGRNGQLSVKQNLTERLNAHSEAR